MRAWILALGALVCAAAPVQGQGGGGMPDLRVVGVYRPLGLEGRTVGQVREVYLQVTDETVSAKSYVGRTCTVYRLARAPISAKMDGQELNDLRNADMELDARASPWAGSSTSGVRESNQTMNRIGVRQLAPAQEVRRSVGGRPPAFSNVRRRGENFNNIISLGPGQPSRDQIAGVAAGQEVGATMELEVGQLTIVSVRDDVVVGQVKNDGLDEPTAKRKGPGPMFDVIMTGDYAFLDPPPQEERKASKRVTHTHKELIVERNILERELARRRKRVVPYRRRIMRWDL